MTLNFSPWAFFLVLGRTSVMVALLPMLGETQIPRVIRVAIALWISMAIYPTLPASSFQPANVPDLLIAVSMEAFVGALFALALRMIFSGLLLGAQWIDGEIGFQAAQQINPLFGAPSSPSTLLVMLVSGMIFWGLGFFEEIIAMWAQIFRILPAPVLSIPSLAVDTLTQLSGQIFIAGLQIAAPVMLVMLLVSVAIGLMARALQGVNILVEGFNIKLLTGLVCLIALAPLLVQLIHMQLGLIPEHWTILAGALKGRP